MDLFKILVWDSLIKAALASLFVALPFLNFWPVSWLINYVVITYSDILYAGLKEFIKIEAIALRNENIERQYNISSSTLKILGTRFGIESQEFTDARAKNVDTMDNLVKFEFARKRAA